MQRPTSHGVTAIAHGVTYGFYYTYQCADHNVADLDAVEIYHHLFDIHGYRNPRGIHSIITRIENATRAAYIATMIPATPDTPPAPSTPVCEVCGAPTQCYVEFDETPDILHAVCDSCDPNVLRAPEFRTPRPTRSIFNVAINADAITPDALIRQLRSQLSEIADTGAYHDVTENVVPTDQRRGACDSLDCIHPTDLTERFFIDPIGMHGAPNVGLLIIHLDCHATLRADLKANYPLSNARRLLYALDGPCGYGAPIFPPTPQPPTRRQCSECNAPATFTCSICDARICPSHGYSKNIDTDPIVCHACAVNHRCTYDCTHDAYALLTPTPRSQSELNSRYAPSVLPTQKYPDPNTSDCARCGRAIYQGFVGVWYHKSTNEKRCSDLPRYCVATPI